jgi:hypothetical protein
LLRHLLQNHILLIPVRHRLFLGYESMPEFMRDSLVVVRQGYPVSAYCIEETLTCGFSRSQFEQLVLQHPKVGFLERLFSLRHQNGLNKGKLAVVVATGIGRGATGLEEASSQVAHALTIEGMNVLGQLKVTGNPECMVCGYGQSCPMSALPWIFGDDTTVTPEKFCNVEDQTETWEPAKALGQEIARKLGDLMRIQPEGLSAIFSTERR